MFNWFKKNKIKKQIKVKYNKEVSERDLKNTRTYVSQYDKRRYYYNQDDLNLYNWIFIHGFIDEIDSGYNEPMLFNKEFQKSENFDVISYRVDHSFMFDKIEKQNPSFLENNNIPSDHSYTLFSGYDSPSSSSSFSGSSSYSSSSSYDSSSYDSSLSSSD